MKVHEIIPTENVMLEMANLYPQRTGVDYVMWFGEVGGQHGPRIKVSNLKGRFAIDDNFTLSVSQTPEIMTPPGSVHIKQHELNKIIQWIQSNVDDLILLWQIHETGDAIKLSDGTILDDVTILNRLKKV
jgi:hypothetical protein